MSNNDCANHIHGLKKAVIFKDPAELQTMIDAGMFANFPGFLFNHLAVTKDEPVSRAITANHNQHTANGRPLRYMPLLK